tara:strand:+ start:49895 stop:51130 length:1236 start_codon:yes stop_codon:yes gene_type:complete
MHQPVADSTSAFDPLTLADVLSAKATAANTGKLDGGGPRSVVAVEDNSTLRQALDELAFSNIKSVPLRAKTTGEILGFFDASIGVRVALEAVESDAGPEVERVALEKLVTDVLDLSLSASGSLSGVRSDGGSVPFACADLPLRELISEQGYLLFEQHEANAGGGVFVDNSEVHRLCVVEARQPTAGETLPGTKQPRWEEIIDVMSQMDIVRCLLFVVDTSANDPTKSVTLKRALGECVVKHASQPFLTFQDAPVAGVFRQMLDKGIGAACVVQLAKWTVDGAADHTALRAIDTLSFSDFTSPGIAESKQGVLNETVGSFLDKAKPKSPAVVYPGLDALGEDVCMADAARKMVQQQQHRCWITNANETPVGVITCTDVLRCVATAISRFEGEDMMRNVMRQAVDGPIVEEAP